MFAVVSLLVKGKVREKKKEKKRRGKPQTSAKVWRTVGSFMFISKGCLCHF